MPPKVRKGLVVPVRLPEELAARLDKAVERLHYRSRNGLIREAIESYVDQLMSAKVVELRDVPMEEARKLIEAYVSKNPGVHHVSELSEELGIELGTAFKAVEKLIQENTVRVRN